MTLNTATAYARLSKANGPFYAEDFGIDGGTINALHNANLIRKTGVMKEVLVDISVDLCKRTKVYQWVKDTGCTWAIREFNEVLEQARELVDWYDLYNAE